MNEAMQREVFAENLKERLRKSGKTQKDVAKDLGIAYTTFNTWCKGESMPSIAKIQMLADYFMISKSELTDDSSDKQFDTSDIDLIVQISKDTALKKVLVEYFKSDAKVRQQLVAICAAYISTM